MHFYFPPLFLGAKKFRILTEKNIDKSIAIVLNKMLISAPRIMEVIWNERMQIGDNFSEEVIDKILKGLKK